MEIYRSILFKAATEYIKHNLVYKLGFILFSLLYTLQSKNLSVHTHCMDNVYATRVAQNDSQLI